MRGRPSPARLGRASESPLWRRSSTSREASLDASRGRFFPRTPPPGCPDVDPHTPYLGCLGGWPFCCENPRLGVLDCLGFPWILLSESRFIKGLRATNRGKYFLTAFPVLRMGNATVAGR